MRILFLHHFPLSSATAGRWTMRMRAALAQLGHETRALVVCDRRPTEDEPGVRAVVCGQDRAADLSFDVPQFGACPDKSSPLVFANLSDGQLTEYRQALRRRLDAEVDRFNPQLIHSQHIWVQGQLALETGAPYLLNAWGPELAEYEADARYRFLADQAAENSSWILMPSEKLWEPLTTTFPAATERMAIMSPEILGTSDAPDAVLKGARQLVGLYRAAYTQRFGKSI